jgi:hypothetical protein
MGFYIRKSFKFGPIRFNLSKSGLGVSAGVKGARIGIDAKGEKYVHLGRGGIYYRQTLPDGSQNDANDNDAEKPNIGWGTVIIVVAALFLVYLFFAH